MKDIKEFIIYYSEVILLAIFLIILFFLIVAEPGGSLSRNEINDIKDTYESDIIELCERFELEDCEIEISDYEYENYSYNIWVTVNTDEFKSLTGVRAFNFAKNLSNISSYAYDSNRDDNVTFNYSTKVYSIGTNYYYDTERSGNSLIEYLMKGYESVYTEKSGTVMYDIFD